MAITENQIKFGPVVKVAGQSEEVGLDVLEEGGKKRAYVSSIERFTSMEFGRVSVTTSQVALHVGAGALPNRRGILVQNLGTGSIYVGKTGVLTTTGFKIAPESSMWFAAAETVGLFAIAAAGTQDVGLMEVA
jgi:hypothetical protein